MTLYKENKAGITQEWSILTNSDSYTISFGVVGGKKQYKTTVAKPKNVGKSNETSGAEQAEKEMFALIAKKKKQGYSEDINAVVSVKLPMKVKSYQEHMYNVIFPCYSTLKLDGVNGVYRKVGNELKLYSRGGEVYPRIPHLENEVLKAMKLLNCNELNGELYIPFYKLQDIQSAVTKPNELSELIGFNVFDIPGTSEVYRDRLEKLKLIDAQDYRNVYALVGRKCNSHEDIEAHYNLAISLFCEGTVIKNADGLYRYNIRSSDQFKYKKTQDAEFLIIGYNVDKNGHPVFELKVNDSSFKAKPRGTNEERLEILENINEYINQWGTVSFEKYSKDGKPLKPVFERLRNCTASGEVIT